MTFARARLKRILGYTFIAAFWFVLLSLVAAFGVMFAIYRDFKLPGRSHLTAGTRIASLADDVYGRFRSPWGIASDAELGYVPRAGALRIHSPEYDVTMTYTAENVRHQPPAPVRNDDLVVLLGDSHTAGLGVADDATFSALLQTRHGHATVNAGVISYAAARELWRARRLGLLAKGDVFVLQFCDNDIAENRRFVAAPFTPLGQPGAGSNSLLRRRQEYMDLSYLNVVRASVQQVRFLIDHNGLRQAARYLLIEERQELGTPIRLPPGESAAAAADDFLAVLDHFPELAGKPIIVIELNTRGSQTGFLTAMRDPARRRANLEVLDFSFQPEDFFPFDGHLNAYGHAAAAAQLHPAIERALRGRK